MGHDPRWVTTHYQPPWVIHAAVARAHALGVSQLEPAVRILAHEVRAAAVCDGEGRASWPGPSPVLATLLAVRTVLDAGEDGPLLEGGVRYLLDHQAGDGSWPIGSVAMGRDDGGMAWRVLCDAGWSSQALDLLCRHTLRILRGGVARPAYAAAP